VPENQTTDALQVELLERLESAGLSESAFEVALAAILGELDDYLAGNTVVRPSADDEPVAEAAGVYLTSISARGFRGIGAEVTLDLEPGPGLTLVVGRNGSGKSSFAEALELLMTGENHRWSGTRSKKWQDGWRNLHDGAQPCVGATMHLDEIGGVSLSRTWPHGGKLEEGTTRVTTPEGSASASSLGWEKPLLVHRPFLPYNELGSMLEEGPTKLHDALEMVLGLDAIKIIRAEVDAKRKEFETQVKDAKNAAAALAANVEGLEDERASKAHEALSGRTWQLDVLEAQIDSTSGDPTQMMGVLRAMAMLPLPDEQAVIRAANDLIQRTEERDKLGATDVGRSQELADLLERAVAYFERDDNPDCPLCGTAEVLSYEWSSDAADQVLELRATATALTKADGGVASAQTALTSMLQQTTPVLTELQDLVGIDGTPLLDAWNAFSKPEAGLSAEPVDLARHAISTVAPVVQLGESLKAEVAQRIHEQESAWRPMATQLAEWLPVGRRAEALKPVVADLKAVKKWLDDTAIELRNERFAPIRSQVTSYWELMRARSNVEISEMEFAGRGTQRRLDLSVAVDSAPSQALGVMSQGELHSLALCLFLPRATSDQSPFRFAVIDDPVQAMDPARVDGLAEVLSTVAESRQIVVFTHDDRLPDACRRLSIDARVIEVRRALNSAVSTRDVGAPVEQYLDDARALMSTNDAPEKVTHRVVPLLCRMSLDAQCVEVIRRRQLRAGESHAAIEDLLADNPKLVPRLALALFDDVSKVNDVYPSIERRSARWGPAHIKACNKGSHKGLAVDLAEFVKRTEILTKAIS